MNRFGLLFSLVLSFLVNSGNSQVVLDFTINLPANPFVANAGEDQVYDGVSTIQLGGQPPVIGGYGNPEYFWEPSAPLDDAGLPNPTVLELNQPTEFILTVTEAGVCESTDTVFVDYTLGIGNSEIPTFKLWPNPFRDVVHFKGHMAIAKVIVTNITGTEVARVEKPNLSQIILRSLPSGMYILRIIAIDGSTQFSRVCKSE